MVYLDNASTTKIDSAVLDCMTPYFNELFLNASSKNPSSKIIKDALRQSKIQCAKLINSKPEEIIFTSGSTEAINLALKGYLEENFQKGNHIVTCKTEHKAVINTCEYLETKGVEVTYLDVDRNGQIDLEILQKSIKKETALIALMLVNNETGVINELNKIISIAKKQNISVFCDATQALGKIAVDVQKLELDMLCMSAHKINGPKGIGFLYVKNGIKLTPLIHGGFQENGLRSGTYNTPLIVGMAEACSIAFKELEKRKKVFKNLNNLLEDFIETSDKVSVIAKDAERTDNIINLQISGLDASVFIESNNKIIVSNGSACTSQIIEGSHVLKAMGYSDQNCNECIRVSFDHNTTSNDVLVLINTLKSL